MMRRRSRQSVSFFAFQDIITAVTGIFLLVTIILALALVDSRQGSSENQETESYDELKSQVARIADESAALRSRLVKLEAISLHLAQLTPAETRTRIAVTTDKVTALRAQVESLRRRADSRAVRHETLVRKREEREQKSREELDEMESQATQTRRRLRNIRSSNRFFYNPVETEGKRAWLVQLSISAIETAPANATDREIAFQSVASFLRWAEDRDAVSEYFVLFVRPSGIANYKKLHSQLRDRGFDVGIDLLAEEATVIPSEAANAKASA